MIRVRQALTSLRGVTALLRAAVTMSALTYERKDRYGLLLQTLERTQRELELMAASEAAADEDKSVIG